MSQTYHRSGTAFCSSTPMGGAPSASIRWHRLGRAFHYARHPPSFSPGAPRAFMQYFQFILYQTPCDRLLHYSKSRPSPILATLQSSALVDLATPPFATTASFLRFASSSCLLSWVILRLQTSSPGLAAVLCKLGFFDPFVLSAGVFVGRRCSGSGIKHAVEGFIATGRHG